MFSLKTSLKRINRIRRFLRFAPFDISTVEGRDNERYRRIILTTYTSVIAKGTSVLIGLISVPLTLNYLGVERYGLWMTITSVMMMLVFADLGLGNGLVNALSEAYGNDDREAAKKAVTSVFFILSGLALLLCLIFGIVYQFVSWPRFFNVTSVQAIQESGPAMVVFGSFFALNLPISIVQRIQLGYQEGFIGNVWHIAGNLISLFVLLVAIWLRAPLPWLVFSITGITTIVNGFNLLVQFFYVRPWLRPNWNKFNWEKGTEMLKTGIIFVLITVTFVIGSAADNIIIAQYLGASEVATYAVLQKLFSLTFIVQFFTIPLWPAFNEALVRSEFQWANKTFDRVQTFSIWLTILICLPLLIFGQTVIRIWAGPQVIPSLAMILGFFLFRLVSGFGETPISVLMTSNNVRKLLLISTITGIITFSLKIIFVQIWLMPGVIWASAIGYGLFFTGPAYITAKRALKPIKEKN